MRDAKQEAELLHNKLNRQVSCGLNPENVVPACDRCGAEDSSGVLIAVLMK